MCGIAGFFGHRVIADSVRTAMLAEIRRRGPDAQHQMLWDDGFAPTAAPAANCLLSARLAVIDPRPEADQPMGNDAGDIWICYNGEVYDWQRDAALLSAQGARFRTRCDTEFILRAYEAWGIDCLARLRGMFALALLDLRKRQLYLARDRMGLKPLVYYAAEGELAFGSTVRTVLPYLPPSARALSSDAIDAYLAHRYVPAPRTILSQVSRLENGHYLSFDLGSRRLEKHRYWSAAPSGGDWRATLDDAVRMRTVADRRVGVFLSSGIDSSTIVCRLAEQHADLLALTAGFADPAMDESVEAARFAARVGLAHRTIPVPLSLGADFERIVADLDEPFADPSAFPSWYLAREAVKDVTVVLSGDGGDELFAGYKRTRKHLRTSWRRRLTLPRAIAPSITGRGFKRYAAELAMPWLQAYSLRFSGFSPGQRRFLQGRRNLEQLTYWRLPAEENPDPLLALLEVDFDNYLPEYILRKADLCTMAHGLELRAPLLDHRLVQTLLALPDAHRFTEPAKRLLGEACAPCVEAGLFERKKRGFNPPLRDWLHVDLRERCDGLGGRLAYVTLGQLDADAVDQFVQRYRRGTDRLAEQLLQLLILDASLAQLATIARTGA